MKGSISCAFIAAIGLAGCNKDKDGGVASRAPDDLNRLRVEVPAGQVVSGFKHGRLRQEFDVAGFSISRRPITVSQFRACVTSGTCSEPALECSNLNGNDQDAALCIGIENARAYCAWSGGRLPHLNEWFLAARGRTPRRFSWGDGAPTCEQHALARAPIGVRTAGFVRGARDSAETDCDESPDAVLRVGRHEAGASPYGLEDVLIASGELLEGHRETNFGACMSNGGGCLIYGLIPGAIDSVKAVASEGVRGRTSVEHPYTLRCVWTEEEA